MQPYPSSDKGSAPPQPAPPPSVLAAVRFMYAGAALSGIALLIGLATVGSLRTAIKQAYPSYTASQVHSAEVTIVGGTVAGGLLAIGLWIWMARANGAGRSSARIIASVLFAFNTLELVTLVSRPHSLLGLLFGAVVWLVGLAATLLLWRPESSAFFQTPAALASRRRSR